MRLLIPFFTAVFFSAFFPISGNAYTVKLMADNCNFKTPITYYAKNGKCYDYLFGVVDTYDAIGIAHPIVNKGVCIPEDITTIELLSSIWTYFGEHPELNSEPAASATLTAISEQFACN